MILFGGFVKTWGLDNSLTLAHYASLFHHLSRSLAGLDRRRLELVLDDDGNSVDRRPADSDRRPCHGLRDHTAEIRRARLFEFALMMSFAIPGTVIGISYIMAFNLPPLEMNRDGSDPNRLLRVP